MRVLGGAADLDAVQNGTGDPATEGKLVIGILHYQVNFGAELDVPEVQGLTVTGRVICTSEEYFSAVNIQSIPDWTRLDLGVRYAASLHDQPVTIRFDVEKVANDSSWADTSQGYLFGRTQNLPPVAVDAFSERGGSDPRLSDPRRSRRRRRRLRGSGSA